MAIIIPSRSFCFVKVPKTAGSSIEAYLSRFISDTYISSPQGPVAEMDKIVRGGVPSLGYRQNVYTSAGDLVRKSVTGWMKAPRQIKLLYQIYRTDNTREKIDTAIRLAQSQARVHSHMTLGELKSFNDKRFPDLDFSYHGFVRNPYDHAFSHFAYLLSKSQDPTAVSADELAKKFLRFLSTVYKPQKYWLQSGDFTCEIYRFESLEEEVQRLSNLVVAETGATVAADRENRFPRLLENRYKAAFKRLKAHLLNDESRERISRICRWEFENYYPSSS